MHRFFMRVITAIQLTRLTMAFGAVSDIWFVILLTRARAGDSTLPVVTMPLASALFAGAVVAVGLFAYGASLNDVLDARHDAAFSPARPIPAGRIRVGQAIVVTVGSLLVAMLGAAALGMGALRLALLTATGILFYNAAARYIPAVGLVVIGFIHGVHMLIPNHTLAFLLPVWLVMTHTTVIAVFVHELEDKRPRLTERSAAAALVAWVAGSAAIISLGVWRGGWWPEDVEAWRIVWPALAVAAFAAVAWLKTRHVGGIRAAEKLKRYGAMWESLYGAAWLLMLGHLGPAAWIAAFAVVGFGVMTVIKEVTGMSSRPVTYRG